MLEKLLKELLEYEPDPSNVVSGRVLPCVYTMWIKQKLKEKMPESYDYIILSMTIDKVASIAYILDREMTREEIANYYKWTWDLIKQKAEEILKKCSERG